MDGLHFTFTFSNLADAFIQSDLQSRGKQTNERAIYIEYKWSDKSQLD